MADIPSESYPELIFNLSTLNESNDYTAPRLPTDSLLVPNMSFLLKPNRMSNRSLLDVSIDMQSDCDTSDIWQMQSWPPSANGTMLNISEEIKRDKQKTQIKFNEKDEQSKNIKHPEKEKLGTSTKLIKFNHISKHELPNKCIISNFESYLSSDEEFVHFQGLSPPICVFQILPNRKDKDYRAHYRMLIPPVYENQSISMLCCRKKKEKNKYRFSTSDKYLQKRNNPHYVGKMKVIENEENFVKYRITLKNGQHICFVKITVQPNSHQFIEIELLSAKHQNNLIETGKECNVFNGYINNFAELKLDLKVSSSTRTVLNVHDCLNYFEKNTIGSSKMSQNITNVQMIDFDYPLTLFLSFAIASCVYSRKYYLK